MKKRLLVAITSMALGAGMLGTAQATAAVEFGSNCTATSGAPDYDFIHLGRATGSALPTTAPISGVITRWRSNVGIPLTPGQYSGALQVYRGAGSFLFTLLAESPKVPFNPGLNTFPTRIPVQAGDFLGTSGVASGEKVSLYCGTGDPADTMGISKEPTNVGSTRQFEAAGGYQVPVAAIIEPDADNDGFGDETQDACPQSATTQGACPAVVLSTSKQVRKGSVTVIVTASTAAPVSVKGVAKLGKGKKAKLNGGTQNLAPGVLGKFKLKFTKALKTKLKELPPKRSLRLNVTVTGTSVSGAVTTKALKVKLKGQEQPS